MSEGLEVQGLSHFYGSKKALNDISFSVHKGTFCALLGPNGAGKSTLFALLTRLFVPSSGEINISGENLLKNPRHTLSKIGVVFQQPTLDLDLSVYQNLTYAAALQGLSGLEASQNIHDALTQLGMQERAGEKVRGLNGGHRRRMEIARALIHKPEVLLLDEATVGLDAQTRSMITSYAHQLVEKEGLTVLWATHLVDEVLPDDQLIILHNGIVLKNDICKKITGKKSLGKTFAELIESHSS